MLLPLYNAHQNNTRRRLCIMYQYFNDFFFLITNSECYKTHSLNKDFGEFDTPPEIRSLAQRSWSDLEIGALCPFIIPSLPFQKKTEFMNHSFEHKFKL